MKILHTESHGAGWVTWSRGLSKEAKFFMLTNPWLVERVESGENISNTIRVENIFSQMFKEKFPNEELPYMGAIRKLKVSKVSAPFRIDEDEGAEKIFILPCHEDWFYETEFTLNG